VFLSLLDGDSTFSEALALTARTQGATAFSQEQALSLYQWMLETNLATFTDGGPQSTEQSSPQKKAAGFLQKLNPFWIRIPFGRADNLLQMLRPVVGWIFSPSATIWGGLNAGCWWATDAELGSAPVGVRLGLCAR
jgi:putative peptide zinc metalloprotease protein